MKRKKTIYPTHEIAHLWAHQTQPYASNQQRNFYFKDDTIFSYRDDWPLAKLVSNKAGALAVLVNTERYSSTTSGHLSMVERAIPPSRVRFEVGPADIYCTDNPHQDILKHYLSECTKALAKAGKARRAYSLKGHLSEFEKYHHMAIAYSTFYDIPFRFPEYDLASLQAKVDTLQTADDARQAVELEERKAAGAKWAIENAEKVKQYIADFRAGLPLDRAFNYGYSVANAAPTMLRIMGDMVQTSLGASFPVKHAALGLAMVRKVRAGGQDWTPNGHTLHLGNYAVDRIEANGTVHAGCHVVAWDEIELLAAKLDSTNAA